MRRFGIFCSKLSNQCSSTNKWNLELVLRLIIIEFSVLYSGYLTLDVSKF